MKDTIDHPSYYGGKDNVYEVIKVIEAHNLGYHIGNVIKYLFRAPYKGNEIQDLKKAKWYLDRYIERIEND